MAPNAVGWLARFLLSSLLRIRVRADQSDEGYPPFASLELRVGRWGVIPRLELDVVLGQEQPDLPPPISIEENPGSTTPPAPFRRVE